MVKSSKIAALYMPVIHRGYFDLLTRWRAEERVEEVWLVPGELIEEWVPSHKDIHAMPVALIGQNLSSLFPYLRVRLIDSLEDLVDFEGEVYLPDEVAMRGLVERAGWTDTAKIVLRWQSVFLRWERQNALSEKEPEVDAELSGSDFDQQMIKIAQKEGQKSADWWRQVGAVLIKDQKILAQSHNLHLPHEQQPNVEGDIRAQFHRGEHWELGTAIHAEADLIALAAKNGWSVAGADLYVTDFPCPNCAKLIARAGIKKVYFNRGYALSDGERVLRAAGVVLIKVRD